MTFIINRFKYLHKTLKVMVAFGFIFFSCSTTTLAQNISEYRWNNRLVIVMTDDLQQIDYVNQLLELKQDLKGMEERKLLIFHVTPKAYKKGVVSKSKWQQSEKMYQQYKRSDTSFEVILIGLDGGIKARKTAIFKVKELFAIIDGMPMRKAEIRNK